MRVELPDGQWAEFRDLSDLRGGDAKAIRRATKFEVRDGALAEISMGMQDAQMDALLVRIITQWSLINYGIPMADPSSLDEIPLSYYNALVSAAEPYKEAIDNAGKSTKENSKESEPISSPAIIQGSAESPPAS